MTSTFNFDPICEIFLSSPEEYTLQELQEYDQEWPSEAPFLFQEFITSREANTQYRRLDY